MLVVFKFGSLADATGHFASQEIWHPHLLFPIGKWALPQEIWHPLS